MDGLRKYLSVPRRDILLLVGGGILLAFGLYNIHSVSDVTEGGVLGATLLLQEWFSVSPALSGLVLNLLFYGFGTRILGKRFVLYSVISTVTYSAAYAVCELFPPLYPEIADYPLAASILGAVFVGVGAGMGVRAGGASGGDDAFAMGMAAVTKIHIQWWYLISDLVVLGLSLTYIPPRKILYSLLTVVLSGQIVGFTERVGKGKQAPCRDSSGQE